MNTFAKRLPAALTLLLALILSGCACDTVSSVPAPATAGIRPGDPLVLDMRSIDRPQVGQRFVVDDRGYITLEHIGSIRAAGFSESELADKIEQAYIDQGIYRTIDVGVAFGQRTLTVGGEVRQSGPIGWRPQMRITEAIDTAGGATDFAKLGCVKLTRDGNVHTIDVTEARQGGFNPLVYPGDSITVEESTY